MTRYLTYDVFTEARFGGNPLAVVPEATGLPEADLQRIAREFNYSETTFVYPPADPAHTAKVRIFTPTSEVKFAGHPVIGTAVALAGLGYPATMVLELGIGPLPCAVAGNKAMFTTRQPLERLAEPDAGLVARCLSLPASAVRTDRHAPVQASLGLPFVIVELVDAAALGAALPAMDALREAAALHPGGLDFAIFCYTRDGDRIEARMFAPLDGVPEDPATGSASATLAALLGELTGQSGSYRISQGVAMGRPSRIGAEVTVTAGRASAIRIEGSAVKVMEGRLV